MINSSLAGVVEAAQKSCGIVKVLGMRYGIEGFLSGEIVDLSKEEAKTIDGLRRTPSSALGSCRYKLQESDLPLVLEMLKRYDIRYFFLIGGNDSMDTIHRIEVYSNANGHELCGIGIPKTVDNDLYGTDHTPGFGSSARYNALSVQQAGRLARDMQRVDAFVVHQTVGRAAGWLPASAALARSQPGDAPHLIYIPERRLQKEQVLADVGRCIVEHGWCSIICGEGILWEDGTPVSASRTRDSFSNVEFGAMGGSSAAINLHALIQEATGLRGEFQITESLPMCAIDRASLRDLEEAYDCGVHAVRLADAGRSGVMVSIRRLCSSPYKIVLETAALAEVAVKAKPMPDEFIAPAGNDVTAAFLAYLQPLVGPLAGFSELANHPAERAENR